MKSVVNLLRFLHGFITFLTGAFTRLADVL